MANKKLVKNQTVKGVIDLAMVQQATNSKMLKPRKRERVTFFGDQTEIIIKSQSKKKIYFQYDQVSSNDI